MPVTIKTNHQWRDLTYRSDVPAEILASEFDYQDAEEVLDGFFHYRGHWYHLDQFMAVDYHSGQNMFADGQWDGYTGDSFFSGVVIRLSRDGEQIKIGRYYS
jgi:hypothetical protein